MQDKDVTDQGRSHPRRVPLWLKVGYSALVLGLTPMYVIEYGPDNFLWFSNIALLLTVVTLWLESRWLASMMALAVLIPEIGWNIDFFVRLIFDVHLLGLTAYMFDPQIPIVMRILSLYHVPLPVLLLWLVHRLGYEPRALIAQTVFGWVILLLAWMLTSPRENINWVYGPGREPQDWMHPVLWLVLVMLAFVILVYLPTHWALVRLFGRRPAR